MTPPTTPGWQPDSELLAKLLRTMRTPETDRLDAHCARGRQPVRLGDANPHPIACEQLEPSRKVFLNQKWPRQPGPAGNLQAALIAFGGEHTLVVDDGEDLLKMLGRGQLWGRTNQVNRGAQSQCHMNSCLCWEANQDRLLLATGYALSDDGVWRQHSWCILPKQRTVHVVETTVPRELYFGYVMTLEETTQFAFDNTDFGVTVSEETERRYALIAGEEPPAARARRRPSP